MKLDILKGFYYTSWNALNSWKLLEKKSAIPIPLKKCVKRGKKTDDLDRDKRACCNSSPISPMLSGDKGVSDSSF